MIFKFFKDAFPLFNVKSVKDSYLAAVSYTHTTRFFQAEWIVQGKEWFIIKM